MKRSRKRKSDSMYPCNLEQEKEGPFRSVRLLWSSHGSLGLSAKACDLSGSVGLSKLQKKLLFQLGAKKGIADSAVDLARSAESRNVCCTCS